MSLIAQVLVIVVVGHLLSFIQLRRAWALHVHVHPGEGGFLYFLFRRRIPPEEFRGAGFVAWRSARWLSVASFAVAGVLILLRAR